MSKYLQEACADIEITGYGYEWNNEKGDGLFYHYLIVSFLCVDAGGDYLNNTVGHFSVDVGNDVAKIDLTAMNTYMDAVGTRTSMDAGITDLKLEMAGITWP